MVYIAHDAEQHVKGLTERRKIAWAHVANAALLTERKSAALFQARRVATQLDEAELTPLDDAQLVARIEQEAATIKGRAQSALRAADALLADKDLPDELSAPLKGLRSALKKRWSDLAATATAEQEAQSPYTPEAAEALLDEAADILRQDDSFDAIRQRVYRAIRQYIREQAVAQGLTDGYGYYDMGWPYVVDLYPASAVFSYNDELFRAEYTIGADDAITLGAVTKVEVAYVPADQPAAAQEAHEIVSADIIPLREAAVQESGKLRIKIIEPGWGSSGYYSEEMLKRDGPAIFKPGTQMFFDHQTAEEAAARPEGSLHNLAGVLTSTAEWGNEDGPGLYANADVFGPYSEVLGEIAPHIGTSIRALGRSQTGVAEGREGDIITELVNAISVDFVTRAGAGGKVVSVLEAARKQRDDTKPAERREASPATRVEEAGMTPEEVKALQESQAQAVADAAAAKAQASKLEERLLIRDARDYLVNELAARESLHPLTRKRLAESLLPKAPFTEDRTLDTVRFDEIIKEAVEAESKYLADAAGARAGVRGFGESSAVGGGSGEPVTISTEEAEKALEAVGARLGLRESSAKAFALGR